jgi:hypothetical protein
LDMSLHTPDYMPFEYALFVRLFWIIFKLF